MTQQEFSDIIYKLKGNWRNMFDTEEQQMLWWTYLRDYEAADASAGVVKYILSETIEPKIAAITDYIDKAKKERKYAKVDPSTAVHCIHCKDRGLIITESPTGVMLGKPCDMCGRGRERHPWEFMSKQEQDEWYVEEGRKGRKPERPFESTKAQYLAYVEGNGKKEEREVRPIIQNAVSKLGALA